MNRLKRFYPQFYQNNKCLLYVASIGLTIPLAGRTVYDAISASNKEASDWLDKHEFFVNLIVWLLCDLVPLCFQMTSMVFGYIRYRREAKDR